jgi:hypothetical protein
MASSDVFVYLVCALKQSIGCDPQTPSIILAIKKAKVLNNATATKRWAQREIFTRGGNAKKQTERQPRIVVVLIN